MVVEWRWLCVGVVVGVVDVVFVVVGMVTVVLVVASKSTPRTLARTPPSWPGFRAAICGPCGLGDGRSSYVLKWCLYVCGSWA
jgi:hypothetical protein